MPNFINRRLKYVLVFLAPAILVPGSARPLAVEAYPAFEHAKARFLSFLQSALLRFDSVLQLVHLVENHLSIKQHSSFPGSDYVK